MPPFQPPLRANGCVLWEGPSLTADAAIVALAYGLLRPSANPKTGPMVQVALLRSDVAPHRAVADGQDASVCNDCPLRPQHVRRLAADLALPPGTKPPQCYVRAGGALRWIYQAYRRGSYPRVQRTDLPTLFTHRRVRLGSYGNFSNAPAWLVAEVTAAAEAWTLYEHHWTAPHAQWLKHYAMASVASPLEKRLANAAGWRTYRVKGREEAVLPDEIVCPASAAAGWRTDCYRCRLCCGTSRHARNIVIDDHGPTRQRPRRLPLPLV